MSEYFKKNLSEVMKMPKKEIKKALDYYEENKDN